MRILIQDNQSKLFLKSIEGWTENPNEALSFPSALQAFYFSLHQYLGNVEIVTHCGGISVIPLTGTSQNEFTTVLNSCAGIEE